MISNPINTCLPFPCWSCSSHDPISEIQPCYIPIQKNLLLMIRTSANPTKQNFKSGTSGGDAAAVDGKSLIPLLEWGRAETVWGFLPTGYVTNPIHGVRLFNGTFEFLSQVHFCCPQEILFSSRILEEPYLLPLDSNVVDLTQPSLLFFLCLFLFLCFLSSSQTQD